MKFYTPNKKSLDMKTKLAIMAIALLTMQAASAQFRFGPKAGANLVKVNGKSFNDEFRYGYHIGGFAEIVVANTTASTPQPFVRRRVLLCLPGETCIVSAAAPSPSARWIGTATAA